MHARWAGAHLTIINKDIWHRLLSEISATKPFALLISHMFIVNTPAFIFRMLTQETWKCRSCKLTCHFKAQSPKDQNESGFHPPLILELDSK